MNKKLLVLLYARSACLSNHLLEFEARGKMDGRSRVLVRNTCLHKAFAVIDTLWKICLNLRLGDST